MTFDDLYRRDAKPELSEQECLALARVESGAIGITAFLATHAGGSYAEGLYRILNCVTIANWTKVVEEAFPDFRNRLFCFGVDWLGRMFALDFARRKNGQWLVLMLEPGTGEALEIPVSFMEFHDEELVKYQNEALAVEFCNAWRASGGVSPEFSQCIGYKTPLFLNGSDTIDNLELADLEMYWSIMGQLLSQVRRLPDRTAIDGIGLK